MTQPPPQQWVDPYGRPQYGQPPPGYWLASDGRWYPPQSAQPPQQQPPQVPPQHGYGPGPEQPRKRRPLRTILFVIGGLFLALVVLGAIGSAVSEREETDGEAATDAGEATEATATDGSDAEGGVTDIDEAPATTVSPSDEVVGDEGIGDVGPCSVIDEDNIRIDVTNQSPKTSSYILTVAFFDAEGTRVGDSTEFLNFLRPGERSLEPIFILGDGGATCEVIQVERFAATSDEDEMADVTCEITGQDFFDHVTARVSATNSSPNASDYRITVAFVDTDGVRMGDGSAFIETVRPAETAPSDVFTIAAAADGLRCEVVAVDRRRST